MEAKQIDRMDSRDLLRQTSKFMYLCDTNSFSSLDDFQIDALRKLVYYKHYPKFKFIRTNADATINQEPLQYVGDIEIKSSTGKDEVISVEYPSFGNECIETRSFHPEAYSTKNVRDPSPVTGDSLSKVNIYQHIQRAAGEDETVILTTGETEILNNRRRLEHDLALSNERLNLMTPKEAAEIAGLFMRGNEDFVYYQYYDNSSSYRIDLSFWCDYLVPGFLYYEAEDSYVSAITDRFRSLFISIDELGRQYYSGAHNNSDILTQYHFNNGISLLTGVTDVLALTIRDEYQISISDRDTNLRVGTHPLLPEVRDYNEDLYNFIHNNHPVIEFLHVIRNDIIHQEGVITRGPGYSIREDNLSDWNSQSIDLWNLEEYKIDKFSKYFRQLEHHRTDYDPVTEWGILNPGKDNPEIGKYTAIEPYRFLKMSVSWMAEFVGDCLLLLSEEDEPDQVNKTGILQKSRLGQLSQADRTQRRDVDRVCQHDLFPLLL
jgi:hypothetical protein